MASAGAQFAQFLRAAGKGRIRMKTYLASGLLAGTILGGALGLAHPALAQTATPPECPPGTVPGTGGACNPADTSQGTGTQPETTTPVEGTTTVPSTSATGEPVRSSQDIVITGTRIPQPNLTSASPVTVLSSQEVKLQGTSRTEDLINSLPQSFAAQGSNLSNGASGTATVNLRNLGPQRTLVLINGRRLMPGDNLSPYPDINFVPTQLIKRVDILTGGASSVYGADAVGGVINFIMDNTFTGLRLDAQASVFQHDNRAGGDILLANQLSGYHPPHGLSTNGGAGDIAAVMGAAFDDGRGHVQAYATYRRQRAVLQSTRDYSFCGLSANATPTPATGLFSCGGSFTTTPTLLFSPATGIFSAGPDHTLVQGYTLFNFGPYNYYQRPDERYTAGAFADYEISPGAKPYLEAMFMDDVSDAVIAPSGAFFGNLTTINCDNALLSSQQKAVLCAPQNIVRTFVDPVTGNTVDVARLFIARRNVEGGGRDDFLEHTDYRIVGGVRGDVLKGISYDASYQYGKAQRQNVHQNDFSVTRLTNAVDVIDNPATPAFDPTCRSVLTGTDPNCVPYDIFTTGGVTQAALDYLQVPALQRGTVQETIGHVDVTVSGADYGLKTPWADNGIGINFGAEYRKESADFEPDIEYQTNDIAGGGGAVPPVKGQFDVRELFAETQIPIVEHNFIDLLQISAGYRYSNYKVDTNSFNTSTYKLALEFAPIRDIRFRASYNRAVRAPNIVELFFPQGVGLAGTADPCAVGANGAPPQATLAQCQLTGMSAAQYGTAITRNPANQYNGLLGGNPNLQPEKADSWTAGVILQPRFIPGLAITADYFNIKVKNVIGAEAYSNVFTQCFNGDATECDLIHRDQFGTLWATSNGFVTLTTRNFPGVGLFTRGWDFNGSYSRRLGGLGTLNASFIGTLQGKTATLGGVGTGQFDADVYPISKWRHKFRVGITLPNGLGLSGQWRYFSAVKQADPTINQPANQRVAAQSYFDLAMTARITNKFSLRMGANNLLDRAPPVVGAETLLPVFGNGNTWPQIYDALGRYMFAGVTVDF
jgi:iron complex outermembrane receptor protein